ncbi:MAG: hypothetical protein WAT37_21650 [Saprospiraceae bacterium]
MVGQHPLRDKIISSICEMDMRMLDVLLPENGVYENAYKEVWLGKLGEFFKTCKLKGDTSLSVRASQCLEDLVCDCKLKVWVFEAPLTMNGIAISIMMDGDDITGIERCYANHLIGQNIIDSSEMLAFDGFTVYDNEKIGFIDSVEFKLLRKKVKAFLADIGNPKRNFVGPPWIKRKMSVYNHLFFDVLEEPYQFEYKYDMLKLYDDLFVLKNLFSQQKEYHYVLKKYHEMRDSPDVKSKIKVVKWFLMNVIKASKYLITHYSLSFGEGKMKYVYKIDGATKSMEIRHPKVKMDVPDYIQFQRNVLLLFDFYRSKYIEEKKTYPPDDQQGIMYFQFRDRMETLLDECEEWVNGVLGTDIKTPK